MLPDREEDIQHHSPWVYKPAGPLANANSSTIRPRIRCSWMTRSSTSGDRPKVPVRQAAIPSDAASDIPRTTVPALWTRISARFDQRRERCAGDSVPGRVIASMFPIRRSWCSGPRLEGFGRQSQGRPSGTRSEQSPPPRRWRRRRVIAGWVAHVRRRMRSGSPRSATWR